MKVFRAMNPSLKLLFLAIPFSPISSVLASNECAPAMWSKGAIFKELQVTSSTSSPASLSHSITSSFNASSSTTSKSSATSTATSIISTGNVTTGEVNCRYSAMTDSSVNYYTCSMLSKLYQIRNEAFFTLNPQLALDCSNIQPNTPYCVSGFIEPLRSKNGLCGPKHNDATCLGTDFQCCNSQTWTCGNSTQDCAPGTCYEGACAGDTEYSTDGTCGEQFDFRQCAGVWGDCCNFNGTCGTGTAFCGDTCQSGNCTWEIPPPTPPDWSFGNSTDGSCGATQGTTCGTLFGECCNKYNVCGSLASDCGVGCQPDWGKCSTVTASSLQSSTTTTTGGLKSSSTSKASSSAGISSSTSTSKATSSSRTLSSTSTLPAISSLPSCGMTCFQNVVGQYSSLGCSSPDPYCLCSNVNFGYGIRDCSNAVCSSSDATSVQAYEASYCSSASSAVQATATGIAALAKCAQTCIQNLIGQYSSLGCSSPDPYCLCSNVNFGYGIRDCSNAACSSTDATLAQAYEASYCSSASSSAQATATGIAALPSCGRTCFSNLLSQYSSLGCSSPDPSCLCSNVNFGYGIRDCSNAACGADIASKVIAYETAFCSSALATRSSNPTTKFT